MISPTNSFYYPVISITNYVYKTLVLPPLQMMVRKLLQLKQFRATLSEDNGRDLFYKHKSDAQGVVKEDLALILKHAEERSQQLRIPTTEERNICTTRAWGLWVRTIITLYIC